MMQRHENLSRLAYLLGYYQSKSDQPNATNGISTNTTSNSQILTATTRSENGSSDDKKSNDNIPISHISAKYIISQKTAVTADGKTSMPTTQKLLAVEIGKCLYRDDSDPVGGALCRIPAMELESPDDENNSSSVGAASLMPSLGQSHLDQTMGDASDVHSLMNENNHGSGNKPFQVPAAGKPKMAASLLHMMASTHVESKPDANRNGGGGVVTPAMPGINGAAAAAATAAALAAKSQLLNAQRAAAASSKVSQAATSASANSTKLEMAAAINMGRPLSFTRSSVPHAPEALIRSLFTSFSSLVRSRVRTWTLLLLRHSLSSGDASSRNNLMSLLASQQSFEMSNMITEIVAHDLTPDMRDQLYDDGLRRREVRLAQGNGNKLMSMDYCDLMLPIQFKAAIDIIVQGNKVTVHLVAPGSVGAIFHEETSLITYMECKIDTQTLVTSMVEQARLVVFQSVAKATSSSKDLMSQMNPPPNRDAMKPTPSTTKKVRISTANLGSYNQSSNNFGGGVIPRSGSLLRQSSAGSRSGRVRSVQWDHSIKPSSSRKSTRDPINVCGKKRQFESSTISSLKRSTQSFGKPDQNIFECSKNSTFAEFGNVGQSPHLSKSSNGTKSGNSPHSLSRYHYSTHVLQRNKSFSASSQPSESSSKNAIFDPRGTGLSSTSAPPQRERQQQQQQPQELRRPSFHQLSRSAVYSVTPPTASQSFISLQHMTGGSGSRLKRTPTQLETLLLSSQRRK